MENHDEIKDLLLISGDSVLTEEQEALLKYHLSSCSDCRADAELLANFKSQASQLLDAASGSEAFVQAVMNRLPVPLSERIFSSVGTWWKIPVFALGAFLILFLSPRTEENTLSTESVLFAGRTESQAVLRSTNEDPTDLLTIPLEEVNS